VGPYTVIWKRHLVEKQLAEYVVSAMEQGKDIAPITTAMSRIDHLLKTDPQTRGESRADYDRVLIVPPLTVTFEVHEDERIVYILTLHYHSRFEEGR
jgi:hypothetical protein